ncbi:MAG: PD40 domain-containing protein [Actinomycetia bacterium]|nr:PD40 domain-containing protein [Actinomycetes bacterium]
MSGEILEDPTWSPDGARIAYIRAWQNNEGHWVSHIYSVNVDGTAQTQLSSGDVRDWRPGWSPDSARIVFQRLSGTGRDDNGRFVDADRHVVVMDDDGSNQIALTEGGHWEQSPVWSPDGTRIAYVSDLVWLVDSDGKNPRPLLTGGAFWDGGVSWSPDGKRLAFARTEGEGSSIVIVEIHGLIEETVTDAEGWDTMPRWSPDGQQVLFTRQQPDGAQQLYVVDASGRRTPISCKPRGLDDYTAGFPLPAWAAPSTGRVKITVLFMDFPNAQATYTTHTEIQNGFSYMVQYLETMSYRKLNIEVDVVHRWWRAPKNFEAYLGVTVHGAGALFWEASAEAVRLADDSYDFSDTDMFITVFPSEHFGRALAGGRAQADGKTFPGIWMNADVGVDPGIPSPLGLMAAHELVHELGLADLYPWDGNIRGIPDLRPGQRWVHSEIGLMSLEASFASTNPTLDFVAPVEMLAWSRWQLDWLEPSQIQCGIPPGGSVTLQPVAKPGTGTVMAAIPLSRHQIIVIENRRKLGYDAAAPPDHQSGGMPSHGLPEEGVLVYTVDTLTGNGQLPIKIAGEIGTVQYDSFPVLKVGESITLRGYTITITNDTHPTYTINITKTD